MNNERYKHTTKFKLVRAFFLRLIIIFILSTSIIVLISYFSFNKQLNKNISIEKQNQLDFVQKTISERMQEVQSIAYSISEDNSFYLEAVTNNESTAFEMSNSLKRYLVGNDFIEHLAYYRLSEPDELYIANGKLLMSDFTSAYLNLNEEDAKTLVEGIKNCKNISFNLIIRENEKNSYFSCLYPLPKYSTEPKAFVLMLIPYTEIKTIIEAQLLNCNGIISIFNVANEEVLSYNNLDKNIDISSLKIGKDNFVRYEGKKYIVVNSISSTNGWKYTSLIKVNDLISSLGSKQSLYILILLIYILLAIFFVGHFAIRRYKPILNLILKYSDIDKIESKTIIDEKTLLQNILKNLKEDSDQKQKYETAYYVANAENKAKSTFFANMSHDIRTPMNAIIGMTEIAKKHCYDSEYVKECLDNITISAGYLVNIINNVLDMSKIESDKFTFTEEVIDFPKFIKDIYTILEPNIKTKKLNFSIQIKNMNNEKVISDLVRLQQVFINILSNSVKFTPQNGNINLTINEINVIDDNYANYEFEFKDNGIGMSEEFINKVFDPFSRAENPKISKIEGTGLGMTIVKNIVNLMGGEITCKSTLGKGTTFKILLKLKLKKSEIPTITNKNINVLVFDKDENICLQQINLLKELEIDTDYAFSIQQATEKLKNAESNNKKYDFILINQSSEDINGIATISRMSAIIKPSETTYVLILNNFLNIEKSSAVNAGFTSFIQLPLFKSKIINMVNRTNSLQEIEDENEVVNLKHKNILLVDDNTINIHIANNLLNETKANIFNATNGKEAVEMFNSKPIGFFSLILMDVQMPIMNGYEASIKIRELIREDALTVPIYALTANTFAEDVLKVKEAGMNGHLGKPYTSKELFRLLKSAIKE